MNSDATNSDPTASTEPSATPSSEQVVPPVVTQSGAQPVYALDTRQLVEHITSSVKAQFQESKLSGPNWILKPPQKSWKQEGLRIQHEFNDGGAARLHIALDEIGSPSPNPETVANVIQGAKQEIDKRQVCLRIADSSRHGWRTVENYLGPGIGDDEDDDKRIRKATQMAENAKKRSGRFTDGGRPEKR